MNNKIKQSIIEKDNLIIKKLEIEDALNIMNWGRHTNELFIDYDLARYNRRELSIWYHSKRTGLVNKYYAIYDYRGEYIGYIGIKNINYITKNSTLGIVLNPEFISQGYGYRVMKIFLDYYFNDLKMKKMDLDVNEFNKRAISLYIKMGFKIKAEYLGLFENQNIDFDDEIYKEYKDYFVVNRGAIYSRIYAMSLESSRYILMEKNYEI